MPGKLWTQEEREYLIDKMLAGLNEHRSEKSILEEAARTLKRSFVGTRFYWSNIKAEDTAVRESIKALPPPEKATARQEEIAEADIGRDFINIVVASRRITTVEAAIEYFKIDMADWEIERQKVKTSEGYRKDRSVHWEVEDGKTKKGIVKDSGKLLVVPLFHIQVTLKRKTQEIRARLAIEDMIADARKRVPKPVRRKFARLPSAAWYELDFPDVHFGKEAIAEESGADYNIHIARKAVLDSLGRLLDYARPHKIEQIILPMGNDFFNVDSKENETTHGTPQQEDTRWEITFREGRRLAEDMVANCLQVAPVKIIMVPGNHDEQRTFYLGEVLDARYTNDNYISVDNSMPKRKYIHFGKNLIGFTHGYWEKITKLPSIMPIEKPAEWAASINREFHLGDKHHKKDLLHKTEDIDGVTIRILRSLSGTDTWHFDKGFIGAPRSAEGFLWDKDDGVVAQFHSFLREKKGSR